MAEETQTIRIVIDSSKAIDGGKAAQRALEDIERNTGTLSRAFTDLESTMRSLFVGYLGMQGVRAIVQAADSFTQLTNALKVAGVASHDLISVQDRLFAAANKNGVEIGAVGQLYSRMAQSSRELGTSQEQMLKFVDGVTAALRIQGGSTESASGALLQLAQAMGAGIVRAEEFNSILEGALPIAQAAARGIDGMEGSVAKLRAAINAGTVTSRMFFDGALKGFQETERIAAGSTLTIAGGITSLTNSWIRFIGELDKTTGGTSTAGEVFGHLAKVLESTRREVELIKQAWDDASTTAGDWAAEVAQAFYDINVEGATARGRLIDTFEGIGADLERIFVDAMNAVLAAVEKGLNALSTVRLPSILGGGTRTLYDPISLGRIGGGAPGGLATEPSGGMTNAQIIRQNTIDFFGGPKDYPGAREAQRLQYATQLLVSGTAGGSGGGGGGPPPPTVGGGAKKEADELGKLIEKILADAQRLRDSFEESTVALSESNDILAAEIKLIDAAPDIRARELAILKATNEAKKAGIDLESQAFKDRVAALEQGNQLRFQQEELAKAQELWTEPLKQALRDIQSTAADAFDSMLESGNFSFEELGKTFGRIVRRMAAEFLALATIRPIMSIAVQAVAPGMAREMGLSGNPFGGIGGSSSGGGGLSGLSMPSWLGGGQPFAFLNQSIPGTNLGSFAGIDAEIANWSTYGTAAQNSLGGISWGAGLGALAGAGMGIYQLASGNGSASSTIGGISSIVGAGLSLIPGIGPFLGAGVSLLGNMLPGLFGMDKPPTITNQEYGDLTYGSNGFFTSGGAWGPNANASNAQGALGGMGTTMQGIFNALGGVKDPSKVWGVALQNFSQQYGDKSSFSNQTSFLAGPNGERIQWGQGSTTADVGLEAAGLAAALKSIMGGAVGEISANLEKGLGTLNLDGKGTLAQLAAVVAEIKTFDDAIAGLGKTVTSAEQAILQIDQSFAAMYATAEKYGLPVGDVDAAKAKARLGVATDFGKSISRGILELTDPKAAALADLDDWRATMVDNNKWLLENVTGALDHINEIERLYGLKRAAIVEQGASQALSGLVDVIKRLTYGDLSGASPAATLSGLTGSFNAMLAQANAGDQTAIAGIGAAGAELAEFGKSYYGSATPAFQNLVSGIRGNLAGVYTAQGGTDPLIVALTTVSAQFAAAGQDNAELKADMAEVTAAVTVLTEKLQRMLDKMAA